MHFKICKQIPVNNISNKHSETNNNVQAYVVYRKNDIAISVKSAFFLCLQWSRWAIEG